MEENGKDGWWVKPESYHKYPYSVEWISGKWHVRYANGNGSSHTVSSHETLNAALTKAYMEADGL